LLFVYNQLLQILAAKNEAKDWLDTTVVQRNWAPLDLVGVLGRADLSYSLRTQQRAVAQRRALALWLTGEFEVLLGSPYGAPTQRFWGG
jgi:hypothetical protein